MNFKKYSKCFQKKDNKIWKYSLSSYNNSYTTDYYYFSDTNCKGRSLIKYILDSKTEHVKTISCNEELIIQKIIH